MVLIGTPSYFKARMDDDALFAHFWMIADESPIPILIYNVPQFTGVSTSVSLIARLSEHENIAGIKESSANIAFQAEVRRRAPERFQIVVGAATTMLSSFIAGACGAVVAIAGVLPEACIAIYSAYRAGDWKRAAELQEQLSPVAAAVTTGYGVPGLKVAMNMFGLFGGEPRLPLRSLNDKQRANLIGMFKTAGYLNSAGAC
jgi:4-hydroxy-2-oxoglutarate aldolase